jgi:hypothetical protein
MSSESVKEQARELVEELPDDADWDELMRRIYVRQSIERGLDDSENGLTQSVEKVRKQFGLDER